MKRRYSFLFFSVIVFVSVLLISVPIIKAKQLAEKGVFTVSEAIGEEIIHLNGDWEFYWKHLYSPIDFQNNRIQQEAMIVEVPSAWKYYSLNDEALPIEGFATYRLRITFHEEDVNTIKALYIPNIATAYSIWIDGEKKASSGVVGKSRESMEPKSENQIVPFYIKSQTVELIIQASNFNQSVAGMYQTVLLGEHETILHLKDSKVINRSVIVMSLLTIGFYHLVLFVFRRKERSLLFFGITCLVAAMRTLLLEKELANFFFSYLDWEIGIKLALNGATLGILFFTLYTYSQFPKDMSIRSRNVIIIIFSLYSAFIVITPAVIFTKTMVILEVICMSAFVYLLYIYLITYIRKREGALLNVMASLLLLLCAMNDFFYFNQMIRTTELTSAGFLFFLFTQSINISKRFSKSFEKTEKLSRDLSLLNESLEKQVYDRTMELQKVNDELHIINEKLLESQESRNRLIQNISHEISTPLTSVMSYSRAMLDKVIPNDEKYVHIIYDKSSYIAQMLDDLRSLTNIENRKIVFQLEKVNIREYTYLLYSKYKNDLESQGITFEYKDEVSDDTELYVMMDKMRIEQVIVNLLSNASKFVKEDGYILLKLAQREEGKVVICVEDNGIGIREDEIQFIFERFFKSLNQVNEHQGSGVGLAISKEIIEYHNGQIYAESKEGKGSCFYFTLPLTNIHIS